MIRGHFTLSRTIRSLRNVSCHQVSYTVKAQVCLVQSDPDIHADLPSQLILKEYDPRFLDLRCPEPSCIPIYPWTLDAECEAAKRREQAAAARGIYDDFGIVYEVLDDSEPSGWEVDILIHLCIRSATETRRLLPSRVPSRRE